MKLKGCRLSRPYWCVLLLVSLLIVSQRVSCEQVEKYVAYLAAEKTQHGKEESQLHETKNSLLRDIADCEVDIEDYDTKLAGFRNEGLELKLREDVKQAINKKEAELLRGLKTDLGMGVRKQNIAHQSSSTR